MGKGLDEKGSNTDKLFLSSQSQNLCSAENKSGNKHQLHSVFYLPVCGDILGVQHSGRTKMHKETH